MIFDLQSLLSNAQAITSTDVASTNIIDLGATGTVVYADDPLVRDVGKGCKIPICIQVVETFAGGTSLAVQVQTDSDPAFGSARTVAVSPAIVTATLKAGYQYVIDYVPRGTDGRYLRLNYDVTGTMTAGRITAGIVAGLPSDG